MGGRVRGGVALGDRCPIGNPTEVAVRPDTRAATLLGEVAEDDAQVLAGLTAVGLWPGTTTEWARSVEDVGGRLLVHANDAVVTVDPATGARPREQ